MSCPLLRVYPSSCGLFVAGVGLGSLGVLFTFRDLLFLQPPGQWDRRLWVPSEEPSANVPAWRPTCMSDCSPKASLDLEALSEALEHLHIATRSLARAVGPTFCRDDWIVVPSSRPTTPPPQGHPSNPFFRVRSPSDTSFRFSPVPVSVSS